MTTTAHSRGPKGTPTIYEYRLDRHDRRLLLVRRRFTGVSEWRRWGRFDTPRQAVYAFAKLTNPSADEGRGQVRP